MQAVDVLRDDDVTDLSAPNKFGNGVNVSFIGLYGGPCVFHLEPPAPAFTPRLR